MKSLTRVKRVSSLSEVLKQYPLKKSDKFFSHKSILRGLLADANRFLPGCVGLARDLVTLEARLEHEGLCFLAVSLVQLGKALDKGLADEYFACPQGFARRPGMKIPQLLEGIFCIVFDPITGEPYRTRDAILGVSLLRQILFFWRKCALTPVRQELLEKRAKHTFTKCDEEIQSIAPFRRDHISRISSLVLGRLDDFQELLGGHGPGAVAEGHMTNQKWNAIMSHLVDLDDRLEMIGYDTAYGLYRDRLIENGISNIPTSDCARLVTVPKTSNSLRTITVEPVLNQFVQQALNTHLRNEIARCSVMSRMLTLNSQHPNQILAVEGSLTGDWVTVDLSSASDRLSTELVETAFANRPRYLSALLKSRTPSVEVGDRSLLLKKFAGMGNATTFPVQSYCFALIALCSMVHTHEVVSIKKLEALASNVRVFGDDIIIRKEHYPALAAWIESVGLKINREKTFSTGNFRESCGVDAYLGHTVTPVYLRHDPETIATDASSFVGTLSTSNQLWMGGMYTTADVLKSFLDKVRTLPIVNKECPGLGYHNRYDLCERQRWSRTLHRYEVRTYVPVAVRRHDEIDGYAALFKFFHSPCSGEFDPTHLKQSARRFSISLRKRWVPAG